MKYSFCSDRDAKVGIAILSGFLGLVLTACGAGPRPTTALSGSTMGTTYHVEIVDFPGQPGTESLHRDIEAVLEAVIAGMSTYRDDSELMRFNTLESTQQIEVSHALHNVISHAQLLSHSTSGAFDVTVGPLVNLWGFGPDEPTSRVPEDGQIEKTRARTGYEFLELEVSPFRLRKLRSDVFIDLSAIAKGYAVDQLAELLDARGAINYLIEIGGDLRARGDSPRGDLWQVAVERPLPGDRRVQRIVPLDGAAMATSGNYRSYFEAEGRRFSHTIDPRTGWPVDHTLASVSVIANDAMSADAYATALLVLGPQAGFEFAENASIAALFLIEDGNNIVEQATSSFEKLLRSAKRDSSNR